MTNTTVFFFTDVYKNAWLLTNLYSPHWNTEILHWLSFTNLIYSFLNWWRNSTGSRPASLPWNSKRFCLSSEMCFVLAKTGNWDSNFISKNSSFKSFAGILPPDYLLQLFIYKLLDFACRSTDFWQPVTFSNNNNLFYYVSNTLYCNSHNKLNSLKCSIH